MTAIDRKMLRELTTIKAMIQIYCRHQGHAKPCSDCEKLLKYCETRLRFCRYAPDKPNCANCPTHCYAPKQQSSIKQVMRSTGPWMLLYHPILSFWHVLNRKK